MRDENKKKGQKLENTKSRRRFLSVAAMASGATALAALPGCGVGGSEKKEVTDSSASSISNDSPEVNLKVQAGFPAKDPLFEVAQQVYGYVEALSGGKMTVELLPAGAVVGALDQADAVHQGVLDGSHAVPAYWYGKNDALSLFGTGPYLGADANTILAWLEYGGGQKLYTEMYNDVLKLDVVPLAYGGMMMQPLGWFRKEVKSADEFKGIKYRTVGLAIDVFKNMGASVVAIPGGEIVPALERGVIDAAEFNNPASDLALGFPDVSKVCMVQSYHQPSEFFEILLNKRVWDNLPEQYQAIWKIASKAASAQMSWHTIDLYSRKYVELRDERGVKFIKTPDDILQAQLEAWDKIVEDRGKDNPLFTKIVDSQKDFMKRAIAYQTTFIASPKQAFDHYFS